MFLRLVALAFPPNQFGRALWTTFVALAILATVWILQSVGYRPCELCLTERIAFYVGAPLAALTALAAYRGSPFPPGSASSSWRSASSPTSRCPATTPASNITSGRARPPAPAR